MIVYVFGNRDEKSDRVALEAANYLKNTIPGVKFLAVRPNEDIPTDKNLVILDTIEGIKNIKVIKDISKISLSPRNSVHDFDLGFQLKYLKKIRRLGKVTIIGLPMNKVPDYLRIQSTLRKLVAQDIQGS